MRPGLSNLKQFSPLPLAGEGPGEGARRGIVDRPSNHATLTFAVRGAHEP